MACTPLLLLLAVASLTSACIETFKWGGMFPNCTSAKSCGLTLMAVIKAEQHSAEIDNTRLCRNLTPMTIIVSVCDSEKDTIKINPDLRKAVILRKNAHKEATVRWGAICRLLDSDEPQDLPLPMSTDPNNNF